MSSSLAPLFEEFPSVSTADWYDKIRADLGARDLEQVLHWSTDGVEMPALRRRDDLPDCSHVDLDAAHPPLTPPPSDAPPNGWRVRQDVAHPDPDTARRLAATAVERGATDLGLVPERTGSFGLNLSAPAVLNEVLGDLALNDVSLHLEGGPAAPVLLGDLLNRSDAPEQLRDATLAFDPVGLQAQGLGPPPAGAFDLAADLATAAPDGVRSLALDTRVYHEAGGTAVQELAYGLGALSDTIASLLNRGVDLSTLCSRLHVLVSVSPRYFVSLAKLRALRLLLPQVLSAFGEETGTSHEFSPGDLFVQAETSRRSETVFDPHVNMLRTTTEAMAAVLGGCDVLNVRPYDAAMRPAENFSARIARNTQLILNHESHFDAVSDPAAGSYYVETLTDKLARAAWETFQSLEAAGGLLHGLRDGTVQTALRDSRNDRKERINTRAEVQVGTNHYPNLQETRLDDLQAPSNEDARPPTNGQTVSPPSTLAAIRSALADAPALSPVVDRLAHPTDTLEPLPSLRLSEDIETLRLRTERHARKHGERPTVVLAPLGPAAARSARATFARNFLGVAGFEIDEPLRFDAPEAAADAAVDADADAVVLCSSDGDYPTLAPALRSALQARNSSALLVVAGNPDALDADVPADAFLHRGSPLLDTLKTFQRRFGIADAPSQ
jgi:methylmalonyl-CoA mutase